MKTSIFFYQIFQVMNIIETERAQLKFELLDNPDSPENCFIEQALDELAKREEGLMQEVTNSV